MGEDDAMNITETTVQNGRVNVAAPAGIPDGTKVLVDVTPFPSLKVGITESEWRDDAAALAEWDAWLKTIEPIDWRPADPFDQEFRRYNIEAVRKQMEAAVEP
jgi:hypothetical protein